MKLLLALLAVALAPVLCFVAVARGYQRTLETARHVGWMRWLGRERTARVLARLLGLSGRMPPGARDAGLRRAAAAKAAALRAGHGLYLASGERAPAGAVMLVGSSTFTYWNRFADDLAPLPVVNAAFGGSTTALVNEHFAALVEEHAPRVIVYFAGTNDITFGSPPQVAVAGFAEFVRRAEERLPQTAAIIYLGVNTTPFTRRVGGARRVADVRAVNDGARRLVAGHRGRIRLDFVDLDAQAWSDDRSYYLWDDHHLNEAGHARLGDLLRPLLAARFADAD
ncbi:MAG: GDSL-type esterase/lipase family protein [Nannocystaceae bacterium]